MQRNTSASALGIALRLAACGFALAPTSIIAANECSPWDTAIGQPGMNAAIWALAAQSDGELIAGGAFTSAGGIDANRIARWDGQQWHALGDGVNGSVVALATLPNGDVVAGGSFTMAGEQPANRIARWDGSNWHALGSGVNGSVRALTVGSDGDLVAAGAFTTAGGIAANHIARWDGTQWHTLSDGVDGVVHALELFDDGDGLALYAGGDFLNAGGVEVNHIAKWDGAAWSPLDVGVDGRVTVLQAMHAGETPLLYVAGKSLSAAGYAPLFMGMARWDGSTREWSPDGDGLRGEVRAMTVFDDGTGPAVFAAIRRPEASEAHIARWDGWWWVPVGSPMNDAVNALAVADASDGAGLYVGGSFTSVGDVAVDRIAQWQRCTITPTTRRVPSEFNTIQAAIDASDDGDIVLVAPGTYNEAINYIGKTIILESEAGEEETIIDATGLNTTVVKVMSGEGVGTVLRGFTVTGGLGVDLNGFKVGGGVRLGGSALTIDSCIFMGNGADTVLLGAGIFANDDAELLVAATTFRENIAYHGAGAAMHLTRHSRFVQCSFYENIGGAGAAVYSYDAKCRMTECSIHDNVAVYFHEWGGGIVGGALVGDGVIFEDCTLARNSSTVDAGALYMFGNCLLRRCVVEDNATNGIGGGAYIKAPGVTIIGSRFERNAASTGGGIATSSNPVAIATTYFCNNTPQHIHGPVYDLGGNTFAESCEATPGDLNGDGAVDVADLLLLLAAWGDCPTGGMPVPPCLADLNGDGFIDVADLLTLLANWG